jgi:hypothetical protein
MTKMAEEKNIDKTNSKKVMPSLQFDVCSSFTGQLSSKGTIHPPLGQFLNKHWLCCGIFPD